MYACASNCLVSGSSLSEQNPTNSQYMDYVMSHVYNVFPREGKMNKKLLGNNYCKNKTWPR